MVSSVDCGPYSVVKFIGPFQRLSVGIPNYLPQIMHYVAARDYKHSFFSEGAEAATQFIVLLSTEPSIQAELHHWDLGLRVHLEENRPGPMV